MSKRGRRALQSSPANLRRTDEEYHPVETKRVHSKGFLDVVHPIEVMGNENTKFLTPIQKAITKCIMDHGGSASETELLDYVSKNWRIINENSVRHFQVAPCKRLLRLNLSIKKNNQQLFIPDKERLGNYRIANILPSETKNSISKEQDNLPTSIIENNLSKKITYESAILDFLRSSLKPQSFTEICNVVEKLDIDVYQYKNLSFKQRLRAILIGLKIKGYVYQIPIEDSWTTIRMLINDTRFSNEFDENEFKIQHYGLSYKDFN